MFKNLYKKITTWRKNKRQKTFHKKLMKQYIKTLKGTNEYKMLYGKFSISFQESNEFNFAPLIDAIIRKAEENGTMVQV